MQRLQGWLSVWSSAITIVSVAFFAYVPPHGQTAATDWTVPAFAVLLPLFGLVWWGFQRREGALRDLAQGAQVRALCSTQGKTCRKRTACFDDKRTHGYAARAARVVLALAPLPPPSSHSGRDRAQASVWCT